MISWAMSGRGEPWILMMDDARMLATPQAFERT
jgi:hypothetical protein